MIYTIVFIFKKLLSCKCIILWHSLKLWDQEAQVKSSRCSTVVHPSTCGNNINVLHVSCYRLYYKTHMIISSYFCPPLAFCTPEVKNSSLKKSRDPTNMTRALLRAWRAAISRVFLPTAWGYWKQKTNRLRTRTRYHQAWLAARSRCHQAWLAATKPDWQLGADTTKPDWGLRPDTMLWA